MKKWGHNHPTSKLRYIFFNSKSSIVVVVHLHFIVNIYFNASRSNLVIFFNTYITFFNHHK